MFLNIVNSFVRKKVYLLYLLTLATVCILNVSFHMLVFSLVLFPDARFGHLVATPVTKQAKF